MAKHTKEKSKVDSRKAVKLAALSVLAILSCLLFFYYLFLTYYQDRFYPGVIIGNTEVGGKTPEMIYASLSSDFNERVKTQVTINHQSSSYNINLSKGSPQINLKQQVDNAYSLGRSNNMLTGIKEQLVAVTIGYKFPLAVEFGNLSQIKSQIDIINQKVQKPPKQARIDLATLAITPSESGRKIDEDKLTKQLLGYLSLASGAPDKFEIAESKPSFDTRHAEKAKLALSQIKSTPIKITYDKTSWTIDQIRLYSLLYLGNPNTQMIWDTSQPDSKPEDKLLLDKEKLNTFIEDLSAQTFTEAHDARFNYDPETKRVVQFQNAQDGQELNKDQFISTLFQSFNNPPQEAITLPVTKTEAKITTASVNNFGVTGLIGQGRSVFTGSIENRIFNLKLAASRINGVLVPPGETFSFVHTIGDITAATGYKPAYVIKSGRTVLDDGGGVCQASTTLFRAVLNAGLPITERTAHAYRVHYYEDGGFAPGLDATIFYPSTDLKFKNDTPGYVLIQAYAQGDNLYVDLYGTPDGRETVVTTPKILSQTPPPPELRQDDPTLPKGTVKQVDWAAWGANVTFTRTVTRNGETLISETFKSAYKPWQAVYLVGTKEG